MVANRKNFRLYAPQHSCDTNYHLLDIENKIEYLIDIHDITDDEDDEEYLFFDTLVNLDDLEYILWFAWTQKEH